MTKPQPAPPQAAVAAPHAAIIALIALLEREQQLLVQPQAEALEIIAAQKQALLKQIALPPGDAHTVRQDPVLRALAARGQLLNAANARMLALHRGCCESRLHLLRGAQSANALYRANGYFGA
jgi:flagellar biosynthesis/type III secretory pathway chaperone